MKFFFDTLNPSGKDILRGSKPSPRGCKSLPALVSRESSNYMFYDVNIFQTMYGQPVATFVKKYEWGSILTFKSESTYALTHRRKTVFFRLDKEDWDDPILIWKWNVHHFQPTKTDCSKLFKLKTDGDSTHTNINVSQPQVVYLGKRISATARICAHMLRNWHQVWAFR